MTNQLLSVVQVAERLSLSPRSVQRLISLGRIKAQKMPGQTGAYIITQKDLDAYRKTSAA